MDSAAVEAGGVVMDSAAVEAGGVGAGVRVGAGEFAGVVDFAVTALAGAGDGAEG